MKRAVVTVIGKDRPGIIAGVSKTLAEKQANILDVSQTLMGTIFTMSMVIDITEIDAQFDDLQNSLKQTGEVLGVTVHIQREEIFNSISQI
ncbi:MAG: ACT domain-containing protein [Oenococcus sp.]|uniref:ACT domain-containing protein n=1 Tax=Oenococcus sp. TaxID=1979414 RepID=UPI0039ECF368